MKGYTRWYKHCKTEKDRLEFQASLSEARIVIAILDKLIKSDLRLSETEELSKDVYENPSWPYFQADKNGEKRAYKKILQLIKDFT